ncbi:hypothetical protein EMPS_05714 [Entomortierella parvispora]|uniref:Uncharacterized protein n=1 Tax=Entomortierella parvispora TaxID=205924 RepID=A0A9P3HAY4_9FUNG|nr:hypothetical protein EMPS_05714 [Entomortierella parvispora]
MLHSPITTSSPQFSITSACTSRPTSASGTRPKSIKMSQGSKQASSNAINIPSPPLTPHQGYSWDRHRGNHGDHDHEDGEQEDLDDSIFSSRFRHRRENEFTTMEDELSLAYSILRQATSAPSKLSHLQFRASTSGPSLGFTFGSNLSSKREKAKEDRESYAYFMKMMEEDYWKSVSTIRSTYFFDGIGRGGGFLAIPHLASHGNAKTNVICRLLEAWLTKKLVEPTISDSIPVLEDNIQSSVQSIERHLKADPRVWAGISQAFIHIRCGHVFMLDACCDDQTIVHLGADEFYQEYPLFVDVEIKMHGDTRCPSTTNPTEVLIAFQNVVNRNKGPESEQPFVHRATITESTIPVEGTTSSTTTSTPLQKQDRV